MRVRPFALLAPLVFASAQALAGVPLPDQPTITDLQEYRLSCQSLGSTITLADTSGQKEQAAKLRANLWERYDAELFARRCQLADYSLAALNPMIAPAERKAAADALASAIAQLAELSTFPTPSAALRAQEIERAVRRPTDAQRTRAETHATLRKIREDLALTALREGEAAALRRQQVALLTRAAAASQPLQELIATARELPAASGDFQNLTRKFAEPDLIEELYRRTGESLALEATLTALIEAAPANEIFWLARARARQQLGWRAGALADLAIASHLAPAAPGIDALAKYFRETPVAVAAVCQEWVEPEDANEVMRLHRAAQMADQPVTALAPALERSARAAIRNRARRLYATSFSSKPEIRARAIPLIAEANPVPPGLFPFIGPELGQQYEAELAAAGNDAAKHFAIQQRHAALFGVTEAFWYKQITLLLALDQKPAVLAATDVAGAMFADAKWIKEARDRAAPVKPLPPGEQR